MRELSTPVLGGRKQRSYGGQSTYKSTYLDNYNGTYGIPAPNARVRTSRQFYPVTRAPIASTYQADFMNFPVNQRVSILFGSSSGFRKNNPHPHNMEAAFRHPNKDYFVWSQYRRLPPVQGNDWSKDSQSLLRQVCQDKVRSTYQQDFKDPPYATDFPCTSSSTRTPSGIPHSSSFDPV